MSGRDYIAHLVQGSMECKSLQFTAFGYPDLDLCIMGTMCIHFLRTLPYLLCMSCRYRLVSSRKLQVAARVEGNPVEHQEAESQKPPSPKP